MFINYFNHLHWNIFAIYFSRNLPFYRVVFSPRSQQTFGRLMIVEKTPTRPVMFEKQFQNESYE